MKYVEAPSEDLGLGTSVFLAGGISNCPDWQKEFVDKIRDTELVVYNPRRANFPMGDKEEGLRQIKWEAEYLHKASCIIFWFPKETVCPIVLFELGSWSMTDKPIFVGVHPDYSRRFDVETQLEIRRPDVTVVYSLDDLADRLREWDHMAQTVSPPLTEHEPHPHLAEIRRSLKKWQESPARLLYVRDESFKVIEVSIVALQQLIDLLKDAEQGIIRTTPRNLYSIVERIKGIRQMFKKDTGY
ncbi:hypothetical protein LCGC14_2227030 [marine sediment metagenome]|uniref:Nucleoside 2-deoxyribosyltransferase like n=1 Tax=marine sediment metagenome TaxID=412755 RepID=A0A0F9FLX5_9ZZZZ